MVSAPQIVEFLNSVQLCTLSTLGPAGQPQGTTVAFSENDDLKLYVGTAESSRKVSNMERDGRVAVTVTDPATRITVQYEGIARRLTPEEFTSHEATHFAKLPNSLPFKDLPGQVYFEVTPINIRHTDCNPTPWAVTELTF